MKTKLEIGKRNIRKISRVASGSSYAITLPIDVLRRWGWKEKQKVVVEIDNKRQRIIVKDWQKD